MQAIILAAGMGRRLGHLTRHNTKCMIQVNGQTLIDRMLEQLIRVGISRVTIVVGYEREGLKQHLGCRYNDALEINYIDNPIYDSTNNIYSLALAKDVLMQDDTLLLESDLIFEDSLLQMLLENPCPDLALVDKYQTWMDGTMVCLNDRFEITNFVPKEAFRYEDVDIYYKTVNIYKFSRTFSTDKYVPFLEAYQRVMGRNEYYEQVLRVLTLLHTSGLKALPIGSGKWYEIDDVQDLDIASTLFSEKEVKYREYHKRYGGFWRFPKLLDYCYLVNPFFPPHRMLEEMKSNFGTLLASYPSGMLVNSLLGGKYFGVRQEYVVVGNGAAELIKVYMERHSEGRVGIVFPTFDEYPNRLPAERIVPFVVQNPNFSYTADDLMAFYADHDISLLLLINPDNPSGNFIPRPDVLRLAAWCADRGVRLLVDESFVDFAEGFPNNSLLSDDILEQFPGMAVMKSISKSYGVPGIRLGILASADVLLMERVRKEVAIWNINSFGEFYMQIFGKYEKDYHTACADFVAERETFRAELEEISYLRVVPSQANYFLCEVTQKYTSAQLTQALIEHDVIISNCGLKKHMGGRNLIRLAVRSRQDNKRLVEILRELEN